MSVRFWKNRKAKRKKVAVSISQQKAAFKSLNRFQLSKKSKRLCVWKIGYGLKKGGAKTGHSILEMKRGWHPTTTQNENAGCDWGATEMWMWDGVMIKMQRRRSTEDWADWKTTKRGGHLVLGFKKREEEPPHLKGTVCRAVFAGERWGDFTWLPLASIGLSHWESQELQEGCILRGGGCSAAGSLLPYY